MNEEEKFLIKMLEDCQDTYIEDVKVTKLQYTTKEAKVILDLINRQQKEIEELDKENTRQQELIGNIHQKWKDKIREKIEELENLKEQIITNECMLELSASVEILKELLGE